MGACASRIKSMDEWLGLEGDMRAGQGSDDFIVSSAATIKSASKKATIA
jgi:hypothetical protein